MGIPVVKGLSLGLENHDFVLVLEGIVIGFESRMRACLEQQDLI